MSDDKQYVERNWDGSYSVLSSEQKNERSADSARALDGRTRRGFSASALSVATRSTPKLGM